MRRDNLTALAARSFTSRKASNLAPLLSVAMATGITWILLTIASGVRHAGITGLLSTLPITRLVATTRHIDVLFLRLGSPAASLDVATIRHAEAVNGVAAVWPEQTLTIPASLVGDLLGTTFTTDCAVYGVPAGFLPEPDRPSEFGRRPPDQPIPVVLSGKLVDLYNSGFAGSQHLPGLSKQALLGRHFVLLLGTSSFLPARPDERVRSVRCEIVGLSNVVSVTGVTVPDSYAQEWHRWYHGAESPLQYASIHVEVVSSDVVARVTRELEGLGLQVQNPRELAEKIALASQYLSTVTVVVIALFLLLAGLGTATTLGLEVTLQAERIGLYRSLGASRRDIIGIYVARALMLGMAGAVVGLLSAGGLLLAARGLLQSLPLVARLPSDPLSASPTLALVSCALGVGASACAGLIPALRAARLDPVAALRSTET